MISEVFLLGVLWFLQYYKCLYTRAVAEPRFASQLKKLLVCAMHDVGHACVQLQCLNSLAVKFAAFISLAVKFAAFSSMGKKFAAFA